MRKQKVPRPYSGAEDSAPSLTRLGMTMLCSLVCSRSTDGRMTSFIGSTAHDNSGQNTAFQTCDPAHCLIIRCYLTLAGPNIRVIVAAGPHRIIHGYDY